MEDFATKVLPPLLADFAREAPEIVVEIEVGVTPRLLHWLGLRHDLVLATHRAGDGPGGTALHPTRLSLVISSPSVAVFIWHAVPWAIMIPLAISCAAGGFLGARPVTMLGDKVVRLATWVDSLLVAMKLLVP